jgi:hypothetical protein
VQQPDAFDSGAMLINGTWPEEPDMSHQPPIIDDTTPKPSALGSDRFDVDLRWSIPGPDSIIPGDTPDYFRIVIDNKFVKKVAATETEITIPGLQIPGRYDLSVCCEWNASSEHTADEKCSSTTIEVSQPLPFHPSTPPPPGRPVPVIAATQTYPASLREENRIKVSWTSAHNYDVYQVRWNLKGRPPETDTQVTINSGGTTGFFVAQPTVAGRVYTFTVQGGDSVLTGHSWSHWSTAKEVTAARNLTSLKEYLLLSGIDPTRQSIRSLMPSDVTLRRFMKLS